MTKIELEFLEIMCAYIPRIAKALEEIAKNINKEGKADGRD